MTFIDNLKTHIGGLIQLKAQLYWYDSFSFDGVNERICILLDYVASGEGFIGSNLATYPACETHDPKKGRGNGKEVILLLLIDGIPQKIWVNENYVELIK